METLGSSGAKSNKFADIGVLSDKFADIGELIGLALIYRSTHLWAQRMSVLSCESSDFELTMLAIICANEGETNLK